MGKCAYSFRDSRRVAQDYEVIFTINVLFGNLWLYTVNEKLLSVLQLLGFTVGKTEARHKERNLISVHSS